MLSMCKSYTIKYYYQNMAKRASVINNMITLCQQNAPKFIIFSNESNKVNVYEPL